MIRIINRIRQGAGAARTQRKEERIHLSRCDGALANGGAGSCRSRTRAQA